MPNEPLTFSYTNPTEAAVVVAAVDHFTSTGIAAEDLAVVTPYAAQAKLLASLLLERAAHFAQVEVDSVDGFQGREKDIVLFSTVRSNLQGSIGFLSDRRRLNVAITRARRGLVIFGDGNTLANGSTDWAEFLKWCRKNRVVISVRDLEGKRRAQDNLDVHGAPGEEAYFGD